MPLRPFPFQLNIGTDISHVSRIRNVLGRENFESRNLVSYVRRLLTRRERVEFWSRYGSWDLNVARSRDVVCKHLAGRWAAKEATIKAVQYRRLSFHDVVIRSPVYGEKMSAVILDKPSMDNRPIEHEISILNQLLPQNGIQQDRIDLQKPLRAIPLKRDTSPSAQTFTDERRNPVEADASNATGDENHEAGKSGDEDASEELSGQIAKISISHDGDYATAVCLVAEEPMPGDVGGEAAARDHTALINSLRS
ncbi:hypothetical protein LTR37_013617 [Vermiconidia calcicola]|uniref:Uncharacterized protein n=1 Tax=Vermiconidia calcicola TaxID=1690605 RepID=A0ACC3MVZ0_9PEZI|nr:hypothetical protein LTR37_013617 [Vermiconidia calcicola]